MKEYKTSDKARQYAREWYQKNREKCISAQRARYLKIKQRLDERNAQNIHPVELKQTSIEERYRQWQALGSIGILFIQKFNERLGNRRQDFLNAPSKCSNRY